MKLFFSGFTKFFSVICFIAYFGAHETFSQVAGQFYELIHELKSITDNTETVHLFFRILAEGGQYEIDEIKEVRVEGDNLFFIANKSLYKISDGMVSELINLRDKRKFVTLNYHE